MNTKRVVAYESLPARLPVYQGITLALLLDRYNAPGWVWGIVGTLFALVTIAIVTKFFKQVQVKF